MLPVLYVLLYRVLAHFYYWLGDLFSRIPAEWAYKAYQCSIVKSIRYDDLSGNNIWKEVE